MLQPPKSNRDARLNATRPFKRHMRFASALALAAVVITTTTTQPALADDQQLTLTAPESPRFAVTDRVWPSEVGQADVCLWKDDKLAAVSFTIDDNTKPDHDWWIQQGEETGWKFTWFVIVGKIGGASKAYFGEWSDYTRLLEAGHDVQSHSVYHLDAKAGYQSIDQEYAPSITQIEENLPGHKVTTLAYPNGLNPNNDNDAGLAAKTFIAVRGVVGTINPVNATNYNNTCSTSTIAFDTGNWADLKNVLNPGDRKNYRGWYVTHYHQLNKPEYKETLLKAMDYIKENQGDLWVGLFREAAMYGQERDTAKLTTEPHIDGGFAIQLSDQMNDMFFTFPLTVKLRVPSDWAAASVTQGDTTTPVEIVKHGDGVFALVPVVPDQGQAIVIPEL